MCVYRSITGSAAKEETGRPALPAEQGQGCFGSKSQLGCIFLV